MENEVTSNPAMLLTGIVLIPVIIWFINQKHTVKTLLYGFLLLLVFSKGLFEITGVSSSLVRLLAEGNILFLFILEGIKNRKDSYYPGLKWVLMFIVISILSGYLNHSLGIQTFLFFRDYLLIFLFYYTALNSRINIREQNLIDHLIIYLFISQIFANFFKLLILKDIVEPFIGTMTVLGGSLTILFALFGASYTMSFYFVEKRKKYLYWTLGFLIFSILGGKRATIIYFPLIFMLLTYVYQRHFETFKIKGINRILGIVIISFVIFYFAVRLMPSLNKEREVWGSFDIEYAINYSESYVTTGAGAIAEVGRTEAPVFILNRMVQDNPYNLLLGYGAGHLIKSSFNEELSRFDSQIDLTESLYGVGYGARTAFLQILLQVGIIGLILYILPFISIYRKSIKVLTMNLNDRAYQKSYLLFTGLWFVVGLDFFTYSVTTVQLSTLSLVFCYYLGTIDRKEKIKPFFIH